MSCEPRSCEHIGPLLGDYAEDRLAADQRVAVSQHLQQCPDCRESLEEWHALSDLAARWQDAPVPDWKPHTPFPPAHRNSGRSWFWWPNTASLAFSLLALVLVLSEAHFRRDEQGFHLSFGANAGAGAAPASNTALEQRLVQFEQQQQLLLGNQLAAWEIEQQENQQALLRTVVNYTRTQQRQDLKQWNDYWETVRTEDQVEQGTLLNELISSQQQNRRELRALKTAMQTTPSEDL